jgi:hypothetical protein
MNMPEVEGMNMLEEHDHLSNHRLEEESMNMMSIYMVEVEGMDMVKECPSNHIPEDEGMYMVEERSSRERAEVKGIEGPEKTTR